MKPNIIKMVSMGGLEPPRITPHAPQTCTSTIPPHRLTVIFLFNCQGLICFCGLVSEVAFATLSKKRPPEVFSRQSATSTHHFFYIHSTTKFFYVKYLFLCNDKNYSNFCPFINSATVLLAKSRTETIT